MAVICPNIKEAVCYQQIRWGGLVKAVKGIEIGDELIQFTLKEDKEYLRVHIMTGDADADLYTLLEYDPDEKGKEFVESFIAYHNKNWNDYDRRIEWFNGNEWMGVQSISKITNVGKHTFRVESFWRSNSTRYNLQSIQYILKYYVGCTSYFFYHRSAESRENFDECYKEWREIKEKFTGKKIRLSRTKSHDRRY